MAMEKYQALTIRCLYPDTTKPAGGCCITHSARIQIADKGEEKC